MSVLVHALLAFPYHLKADHLSLCLSQFLVKQHCRRGEV